MEWYGMVGSRRRIQHALACRRADCKRFAMPADPEIGLSSEWAIGLSACRVIELSGHRGVELLDAKMYGELVAWIPWKC